MNLGRMDPEESLEEWLEGGERAGDSSCLPLALVIAILVCGLLLPVALCWTILLVHGPCMNFASDSYRQACEREFFMREKWSVMATVAIAGLFVILIVIRRYIVVVNGEGGL